MIDKFCELLEGVKPTIISGVFLAASLILSLCGIDSPVDPAWVSLVISGIPLVRNAVWKILNLNGISKISSALLISIAMLAAIIIGDLFAAAEVAFIMAIGEILEDKTTERARKGLRNLISLAPTQGRRISGGTEEMIPAEEIRCGDILRILPGETIPVDGEITSGETSIDQSIMTGESLPVDKTVGDSVFCGTINRFGAVDIRATKVGEDSSLQRLIAMVREAEDKKAPMQRIADKWASYLVPLALLLAIIAYIVKSDIVVAVTILVVFCPCALVLATPTAIMAAIGQATKHGVIIKSGEALEKMGKVNTIAFDKTGTLTYGKLEVSDIIPLDGNDTSSLLSIAAAAEQLSEHPLGKAIVAKAKENSIEVSACENFVMTAGRGVSAVIEGHAVLCGNEKYLADSGITLDSTASKHLTTLRSQGKASVLVARDGKCIGMIALSDTLRPEAGKMVNRLKDEGVRCVLLTGDNTSAAQYFAQQVGIDEVCAELLPEEKVSAISKLQQSGRKVCMIGDGVNDAPALKTADVGAAMGTVGSDIAVDAADIALIGDDISKIPYLKRLSNATARTIKFSISLSLIINLLAIVLSFMEVLTPTTGALVHNAGSCFVVLIAALLYDRKFE